MVSDPGVVLFFEEWVWKRGPDAGRHFHPQEQNSSEDRTFTVTHLQTKEKAGWRGPNFMGVFPERMREG